MANIFIDEPTSRLSVKIPINADGNIAQKGETATGQKSVSIKGFVNDGTLSNAGDVMEVFLGTIANTNYDSLSTVRYDTATVGEGQSQELNVDDDEPSIGANVGDSVTVNIDSVVPTDTALILSFNPSSTEYFNVSSVGRAVTFTRTKTGSFYTGVVIKSDEVAGYAASSLTVNVSGN